MTLTYGNFHSKDVRRYGPKPAMRKHSPWVCVGWQIAKFCRLGSIGSVI